MSVYMKYAVLFFNDVITFCAYVYAEQFTSKNDYGDIDFEIKQNTGPLFMLPITCKTYVFQ